jgi:hypothetical protein
MKLRYLPHLAFLLVVIFPSMLHGQLAWKVFGKLSQARNGFCVVQPWPGQVLVIGGFTATVNGTRTGTPTTTCERIDVQNRTIVAAPSMLTPRAEFVALLTPDSNVIVLGGETGNGTTTSCELFDRGTGRWRTVGNLLVPRRQHVAQFISNDEILVVGGRRTYAVGMVDAEIFTISTGTSRRVADYPVVITDHAAGITKDGSFVVIGGREGPANSSRIPTIYRYDAIANNWVYYDQLTSTAAGPAVSKLWDGRLIISGGAVDDLAPVINTQVWFEELGRFPQRASMTVPRCYHSQAQWSSDSVLAIGGWGGGPPTRTTDWINVRRGQCGAGPILNYGRAAGQSVSIPVQTEQGGLPVTAIILAISGISSDEKTNEPTVEILEPPCTPYARRDFDTAVCTGESLTLTAPSTYASLKWSTAETSRSIVVSTPGVYWVTGASAQGCQQTDTIVVENHPRPRADAGSDIALCAGTRMALAGKGSSGTPPYVYSWNPTTGLSSSNVASPIAQPDVTTKYTLRVIDANGCWDTSSVTVSITPNPLRLMVDKHSLPFEARVTAVGRSQCDSVRLRNAGDAPVTIADARLIRNAEFYLVAGQLPLSIAPGEIRGLAVCYYPSTLGVDRDTLMVSSTCNLAIPIAAVSSLAVQIGANSCTSDLRFKLDTADIYLKIYSPFPNPSSHSIQIPVELIGPEAVDLRPECCMLVDVMGNEVATGKYSEASSEMWNTQVHALGSFTIDVRGVAQGLYFVRVASERCERIFPVIVGR